MAADTDARRGRVVRRPILGRLIPGRLILGLPILGVLILGGVAACSTGEPGPPGQAEPRHHPFTDNDGGGGGGNGM